MVIHDIRAGIVAGIAAGALWGLVFLAPELTPGFGPLQLSAGRYLAYGIVAAVLLVPSWRAVRGRLAWRDWRTLAGLALTGNILYYVLLAQAVQSGGVAMASLVIGLVPVAVALAGSLDRHAVPLRRLVPSLALSAAGLACIGWESLAVSGTGLLCALGALVSWTVFAMWNSRCLARLHDVGAHHWSLLLGVVTGAVALLLAVPAFVLADIAQPAAGWWRFIGVVGAVALLCSVLGNALWNHASRMLPMALMGQMIVFETVFGLLYGLLWEARWPSISECLAMALLLAGVASCTAAHRRPTAELVSTMGSTPKSDRNSAVRKGGREHCRARV